MKQEMKRKAKSEKRKVLAVMLFAFRFSLFAHPSAAQDTLRLPELQDAAVRQDPRARQLALREEALGLRLRNLESERLPRLQVSSRATHDSEVATIPIAFPGIDAPTPPHDRYEATFGVEQPILDPSLRGRAGVERARLAVERAELEAELYPLRVEVSEAFFSAFLARQRSAEILVLAQDLEAQLAVVRSRVREGAALPGDTATLRAELLGIAQQLDEVETGSGTAISRLRALTGLPLSDEARLALPALDAAVARASADSLRAHPGFAVLAARRESIARSERLVGAQLRPSVSAFGQLGFGRPGPALFERDPHEFWSAGVQLQWVPWTWKSTERERSLLALEERLVDTEEEALVRQLEREVEGELRTVERLRAALATDATIVALREQVERQAAAQLAERVISPAEYVRLRTDLQEARLAQQRHRVELAHAQARYLTTLGLPLEER
jgi:outer membrane protein TolC